MARMHARKKGQAGSTKPVREKPPSWVDKDEGEVEELVIKLAKEGKRPSEIGRVLKEQHGVPDVEQITDKKITEIVEENDLKSEVPEDLFNLIQKAVRAREHVKDNPKDTKARRNLNLIESKIKRVVKYYKEEGELPEDWRYSPQRAKLMVE